MGLFVDISNIESISNLSKKYIIMLFVKELIKIINLGSKGCILQNKRQGSKEKNKY